MSLIARLGVRCTALGLLLSFFSYAIAQTSGCESPSSNDLQGSKQPPVKPGVEPKLVARYLEARGEFESISLDTSELYQHFEIVKVSLAEHLGARRTNGHYEYTDSESGQKIILDNARVQHLLHTLTLQYLNNPSVTIDHPLRYLLPQLVMLEVKRYVIARMVRDLDGLLFERPSKDTGSFKPSPPFLLDETEVMSRFVENTLFIQAPKELWRDEYGSLSPDERSTLEEHIAVLDNGNKPFLSRGWARFKEFFSRRSEVSRNILKEFALITVYRGNWNKEIAAFFNKIKAQENVYENLSTEQKVDLVHLLNDHFSDKYYSMLKSLGEASMGMKLARVIAVASLPVKKAYHAFLSRVINHVRDPQADTLNNRSQYWFKRFMQAMEVFQCISPALYYAEMSEDQNMIDDQWGGAIFCTVVNLAVLNYVTFGARNAYHPRLRNKLLEWGPNSLQRNKFTVMMMFTGFELAYDQMRVRGCFQSLVHMFDCTMHIGDVFHFREDELNFVLRRGGMSLGFSLFRVHLYATTLSHYTLTGLLFRQRYLAYIVAQLGQKVPIHFIHEAIIKRHMVGTRRNGMNEHNNTFQWTQPTSDWSTQNLRSLF